MQRNNESDDSDDSDDSQHQTSFGQSVKQISFVPVTFGMSQSAGGGSANPMP